MARVRVEVDYHEFYRILAADGEESSGRKVFATMKDAFMLSLGFGVAKRQRTPLAASREIFQDTVLRPADWDVIKAAVIAEDEKQLQLLEDDEQLVRIAEEYANTGIRILQDLYLSAQPEESLAAGLLNVYLDREQAKAQ